MSNSKPFSSLLSGQTVVPVVVIENEQQALGLSRAFLDGGVSIVEVTLRNSFGVQAIEIIKREFPEMVVVAGTVTTVAQMSAVADAGADGVVSPGISQALLDAACSTNTAYLPGVATASDVMMATDHGLTECKLFPATVVGGIGALKAFSGPFSAIKFCPTGGVNADNYQEFLALDNVMCVGGSWIAPTKLVSAEQWSDITALCNTIA